MGALLCLQNLLLLLVVLGLLQELRLGVPVLGLHFLKVWILEGHRLLMLLLGRVLGISVALVGSIHYLTVLRAVAGLVRVIQRATLAMERTVLVRVPWTSVGRA